MCYENDNLKPVDTKLIVSNQKEESISIQRAVILFGF